MIDLITDYKIHITLLTLLSIALGFYRAHREAVIKYGRKYMEIISEYQWKCIKGISPIFFYFAVAIFTGEYEKLLNGVAFSMAALVFFAMSTHEMSKGFGINHKYRTEPKRIALLSRINIIGLVISTVTVILVFQMDKVNSGIVLWQSILLGLSIATFYTIGVVVNFVKIGYVPQSAHNEANSADAPKARAAD